MTTAARPRRGSRPTNRRALIVAAATELFRSRGYEHVSMGDIAEAVAVGPSALYRYFPGKHHLLTEVVRAGLMQVDTSLAGLDLTDRAEALAALARIALDHRHLGVLWQREARHLPPAEQTRLRAEVRGIAHRLAERIAPVRPELSGQAHDLLAWAVLSVLLSPSFHQLQMPRPAYEALLADLAGRVLDAQLPAGLGPASEPPAGLLPRSRREAVLAQAVRLFAERSYASVGIEDIAASLDIAGPSVYNHVPSKIALLITPLHRGTSYLQVQLSEVLATADDAGDALHGLIQAYTHFAFQHHHLVDLLITEIRNLPDNDRQAASLAQREYIAEWVYLLQEIHPELDPTTARIQVQTALTQVNDAARTAHIRAATGATDVVVELCRQLLALPSTDRRALPARPGPAR
jgi:AcrR family transcriptional regulator